MTYQPTSDIRPIGALTQPRSPVAEPLVAPFALPIPFPTRSTPADDAPRGRGGHALVVVTPVYEDREAATRLLTELAAAVPGAYVVVVDDGSVRVPFEPDAVAAAGLDGEVLRLRRNVGHQRAIAIGLCHVATYLRGHRRVVVMDADGEDRPQSIPALLAQLDARLDHASSGAIDAVVARRRRRVESRRFKAFYWGYGRFFELLVGRRIDFGNFMVLTPAAVRRLTAMPELWIHVPASLLSSKLRVAHVPVDRGARYAGQSRMNFVGLALHGFRGLMVFSEDVLVRMGIACTAVALLSVIGGVTAVGMKLAGRTTPGWSTVVLGVLLLVFLQMGALTLMMLMLAGLTRASGMSTIAYEAFIDARLPSHGGNSAARPETWLVVHEAAPG